MARFVVYDTSSGAIERVGRASAADAEKQARDGETVMFLPDDAPEINDIDFDVDVRTGRLVPNVRRRERLAERQATKEQERVRGRGSLRARLLGLPPPQALAVVVDALLRAGLLDPDI